MTRHHPAYEERAQEALYNPDTQSLCVVAQRVNDIFNWIDWVVMDHLPLSFCERERAKKNTTLSPDCAKTFERYKRALTPRVEATISASLPRAFGLVLDGWTSRSSQYIAIFAVFSTPTSTSTFGSPTTSQLFEDRTCAGRRFLLLAFCPMDDEEGLSAQSRFDLIADTLSRYGKPWESVAFKVGDNCFVNQYIGRREGAIPLIGCASHRCNLCMRGFLQTEYELLDKAHMLMSKVNTIKGRSRLSKASDLPSVLQNDMRRPSTITKPTLVSVWACVGLDARRQQNVLIDADDVFFVRFIRMETCEEQRLSIFPDSDFVTCPLYAIALELITQTAFCPDLLDNLPTQVPSAAIILSPDTPLIDLLDHPGATAGLQTPIATGSNTSPTIHGHVNHRVAKRAGVDEQLTSHSFRRGGAWNVSTTIKAFNYVFNTLIEDHKVSKVLSSSMPTKRVPLAGLKPFDAQTQEKITEV